MLIPISMFDVILYVIQMHRYAYVCLLVYHLKFSHYTSILKFFWWYQIYWIAWSLISAARRRDEEKREREIREAVDREREKGGRKWEKKDISREKEWKRETKRKLNKDKDIASFPVN